MFSSFLVILFIYEGVFASSNTLFDALQKTRFLHEGITTDSDRFTFSPLECMYLEGENITCQQCSWAAGCSYKYLSSGPPPTTCNASTPQTGYDRPGGDKQTIPFAKDDWTQCQHACCDDFSCFGWVYVSSAPGPYMTCKTGDHCCYLKGSSVTPVPSKLPAIITGAIQVVKGKAPELGIRSAVPLGGIGAGALELRGDGTFHEVTIHNQHPASSAKYGVLQDAILGLYLQTDNQIGQTRAIRTSPPPYATGISKLGYSGSYPLTRLNLHDDTLQLQGLALYAYSTLKPSDVDASAVPGVVFTLVIENPTPSPARASLFFNLPFGGINDCARVSSQSSSVPANGYPACLHVCDTTDGCTSWSFDGKTCYLNRGGGIPNSVFRMGWYCGIAGGWSASRTALTLHATPPSATDSPASGNVTLTGVGQSAPGTTPSLTLAVSDDPSLLFRSFQNGHGAFTPMSGLTVGPFSNQAAAHGAAALSVDIPSKETATLSIIFTWYFPERDHMGVNVGNYYSNLAHSSEDFSQKISDQKILTEIVNDINIHHSVFSNADTSYPLWLQDHMINQMSHFRGMMYLRDGRMREYEAPDCPDVDSIHNDYQRHLPYIWVMPKFELSKMDRWGAGQATDGHLWEDLGSFGLGPLDRWGDRIMGDTTSLWVVEMLEYYRNTNDTKYLMENYHIVVSAVKWMVDNANTKGQGLPYHLVCTYDIINFDQYDATTFNSLLYLTAMRAGEELAIVMGDTTTRALCQKAFQFGQSQIYKLLWNDTHSYFRAYTGGDAIMGDCLYGQVVAHHLGLGWLVDLDKIQAHLNAEIKYNGDPYGIKVVTGRHTPPPYYLAKDRNLMDLARSSPRLAQGLKRMVDLNERSGYDTQDDVIWMGAAPDWSYLQIALNASTKVLDLTRALAPVEAELGNYRDRLRDLWNIVGIISPSDWGTDETIHGVPYVTSHYGFVMTDYYLPTLLSGQQTNIPRGILSFAPVYPCPFNLPLVLANVTGVVYCNGGVYTVSISFGTLNLPAGGLSVNGRAHPVSVSLGPGGSVSW